MRRNMKNKLCELCGTPVRVVGDVTKHYEPIKHAISVIEENEKLKKHDCKKWFGEAQGCSICSNIILKSPVKSMDKMFILCEQSNWHISELQAQLATLREAVLAFKLPEKMKPLVTLREDGVECRTPNEWSVKSNNCILDEIQPLLDKLKEVAK